MEWEGWVFLAFKGPKFEIFGGSSVGWLCMRVKYGDPMMARLVNVAKPDWPTEWRRTFNGRLKNRQHRTGDAEAETRGRGDGYICRWRVSTVSRWFEAGLLVQRVLGSVRVFAESRREHSLSKSNGLTYPYPI